jgi:archaellum biogenesis ATPase FlaH
MLLAGCVQDSAILDKVKRTGITPQYFEDQDQKALFTKTLEVSAIGLVNQDTLLAAIQEDRKLDQPRLKKIVQDLYEYPVDNSHFSLQVILKRKRELDLRNALKDSASKLVLEGATFEDVSKDLTQKLHSLQTSLQDIEINDYFSNMFSRDVERKYISTSSRSLKFTHDLHHLSFYFPRGLAKQTGTVIEGPTGGGKSLFLANLAYVATSAPNLLNVLYVFSENRAIEALSRLDAIFTDTIYDRLYEKDGFNLKLIAEIKPGSKFGELKTLRAPIDNFNATTIENALDMLFEEGITIDVVLIDSPDHMMPLKDHKVWHQNKAQVWADLKALYEKWDVALIGTRPQNEGQDKKDSLTIQSGAGGQGISRLLDNSIAFTYDSSGEALADHRIFTVTKARDSRIDWRRLRYKMLPSLRFIHEEDFNKRYGTEVDIDEIFE